jgi:redox-sensitive bicupin YhaK (pirin superfamily)
MIQTRRSEERGHANHGWLDSYHTFSFADYQDPKHMGFRSLRVINEDVIAGGGGFGMHPHRDMEIVTFVLSGALRHEDSMGNSAVMKAGDVQRISAGTGILHSEHNASPVDPVHLLQIWILPNRRGVTPRYAELPASGRGSAGMPGLLVSPDGVAGSLPIHSDTFLHLLALAAGERRRVSLEPGRHAWIQVASGGIRVNGLDLKSGDGAAVSGEKDLEFESSSDSRVLVFDLA